MQEATLMEKSVVVDLGNGSPYIDDLKFGV
jgi:hypothetical protein